MTYVSGGSIIAISVLFPLMGLLALGLRYYFRISKQQDIGPDDCLSAAAWIFTTGTAITFIISAARHTMGYHSKSPHTTSDLENLEAQIILLEKFEFVFTIFQTLALGFTKLSILCFYRRIFRGRTFNICNWTFIGLSTLWTIIWMILAIFPCGKDIAEQWNFEQAFSSKCLPNAGLFVGQVVTDVALDIAIICIPLPLIWKLQMLWKQKFSVTGVFLLGGFSIAAGITRLVINVDVEVLQDPVPIHVTYDDSLGIASLVYFWAYIEIGVAMIISCVITLRPASAAAALEELMDRLSIRAVLVNMRQKLFRSSSKTSETIIGTPGMAGNKVPRIDTISLERKSQTEDTPKELQNDYRV